MGCWSGGGLGCSLWTTTAQGERFALVAEHLQQGRSHPGSPGLPAGVTQPGGHKWQHRMQMELYPHPGRGGVGRLCPEGSSHSAAPGWFSQKPEAPEEWTAWGWICVSPRVSWLAGESLLTGWGWEAEPGLGSVTPCCQSPSAGCRP